jgi:hypothetical protein
VGLIQRELEKNGIATAGISIAKEISLKIKPSRTLFIPYPFGHPFGEPLKPKQHKTILKDLLHLLETAEPPFTLVESTYRWRRTNFEYTTPP